PLPPAPVALGPGAAGSPPHAAASTSASPKTCEHFIRPCYPIPAESASALAARALAWAPGRCLEELGLAVRDEGVPLLLQPSQLRRYDPCMEDEEFEGRVGT